MNIVYQGKFRLRENVWEDLAKSWPQKVYNHPSAYLLVQEEKRLLFSAVFQPTYIIYTGSKLMSDHTLASPLGTRYAAVQMDGCLHNSIS